jgi:hypothetical protein
MLQRADALGFDIETNGLRPNVVGAEIKPDDDP